MIKNKFKFKLAAVLVANLFVVSLVQADDAVTSFKDMVEKTVTANPEVQARYHKLMETGFEQEVSRGGFFPKADIVSTYRKQEDVSGNYSAQSRSGFATPRMNNELVIRQMIFDGFATSSDVKRLDHNKKMAYYDLQNAMQSTTLEFTRAYLDILRYRELTQMAKDNYVVHKQLAGKIQERVNAGVARKVDADQATGRLALAEANLLVETTNLHDVTARMQRIYGELPPETLEAPTFYNAGIESSSEEALKLAYNQNPDLLAKIEGIQASKDEIKLREARYMPRLDLQGRKNLGHSDNGRFSNNVADVLELTMNFNLFNGFSDKNLIQQTAEKLNESKDMRDKACVDTRQTVVIAYNDIQQLKEQLNYRMAHKNSIENARGAYQKQFDIGQRTLLDLLDTENEYFQAKRTLVNAEYDLQAAYARTYAGQGELLKKIGAQRAGLPEVQRDAYLDSENVCQSVAPVQMNIDKAALVADAKPLPSTIAALPVAKPVAAAACNPQEVTNTVKDWASASAQKNANSFLNFYSDKFVPSTSLTKAAWESQVRNRMSQKGKTDLTLENIKVTCNGDKANAVFDLNSTTTTYKLKKETNPATGCEVCNMKRIPVKGPRKSVNKALDFDRVGNQWKIINEQPL
jgi:adhesin transport system outer membrane protein